MSDRAAHPYQGRVRTGAKGTAGSPGLEPGGSRVKNPSGSANSPNGHREPSPSADLGGLRLQGAAGLRPGGRALGGGRTRNIWALDPASLPVGVRAPKAATRCRPGPPAVRERGRSRARRQAARRGFEPRPPRPERGVLPVRRTGIGTGGAIRTGTGQDLSLLSAAIGLRPRAPPGSRSPFSGLRVQCITSHACGAWSRTGESNPDDLLGRQAS